MSAELIDTAEAEKGYIREVIFGLVALGLAYGLASYAFLADLVVLDLGLPAQLIYLAPATKAWYWLLALVFAVLGYRNLAVVLRGQWRERLKLFKVACLIIFLATAVSALPRLAIYLRFIQHSLPAKVDLWQEGNEHLIFADSSYRRACWESLQLDYPTYGRRSESSLCRVTPGSGMEFSGIAKDEVREKVLRETSRSWKGWLYFFAELALLALSALLVSKAFHFIQRRGRKTEAGDSHANA